MRRVSLLLGVAASGVGVWLITRAHAQTAGCVAVPVSQPGLGASPGCSSQVWVGYAGFALLVGGLLALAAALLLIGRDRAVAAATVAARRHRYVGTPGDAMARAGEIPDPAVVRPLREADESADRPSTAA